MVRTLLAVLLPALALPAAGTDLNPPRPGSPAAEAVRLLRDSRRPDAPRGGDLVVLLEPHVDPALPELVDLLVARRIPALETDGEPQTLSVPQRRDLLAAMAGLPRERLSGAVDRLLVEDPPPLAHRAVAVRLLGLAGGPAALERMIDLASPGEEAGLEPRLGEAFEWAVGALLEEDTPGTCEGLIHARFARGQVELLPGVLRAVGDHGHPAGVAVVLAVAERHHGLRVASFAQARRLGASGDPAVDAALARLARRHLDPDEPVLARAAALVLGELADPEAVPLLIDRLDGSALAAEAHWALQRTTGLKLSPDPDRWGLWYEQERRFFGVPYRRCLTDLHGDHAARAVVAIRELSRHRLHRHEVAAELATALREAPPQLRRLLCHALEALGSRHAVPALVERLRDEDPEVSAAALRALRSLTEIDLPADPEAWREAF